MDSGIYRIQCGPWFYYGQSQNLKERKRNHLVGLRNKNHKNIILQRAFDKYQKFDFVILAYMPLSFLNKSEQAFLDFWHGKEYCANIAKFAEASARGMKMSDESKAKMRASYFARSEECRKKLEVGRKGRKWSEETRVKIKTWRENNPITEEEKRNTSERIKEMWKNGKFKVSSGYGHPKQKTLYFIMPNGERLEFPTGKSAAQGLGVSIASINKWLSGEIPWPGQGKVIKPKTRHLTGITGGYV